MKMKYTGMRSAYGAFLIVLLGFGSWSVYDLDSTLQKGTFGANIMFFILLLLLVCLVFFFLFRFVRWTSYAMIQDDGIHVFSRKKEELTFISWESIKECKLVRAEGRFAYLMLIFQYSATYAKRPISLYKAGQRPTYKEVWQHRMDECMDKLARGKLTEEEFKQIPYLLLAPSKDKLFE